MDGEALPLHPATPPDGAPPILKAIRDPSPIRAHQERSPTRLDQDPLEHPLSELPLPPDRAYLRKDRYVASARWFRAAKNRDAGSTLLD